MASIGCGWSGQGSPSRQGFLNRYWKIYRICSHKSQENLPSNKQVKAQRQERKRPFGDNKLTNPGESKYHLRI